MKEEIKGIVGPTLEELYERLFVDYNDLLQWLNDHHPDVLEECTNAKVNRLKRKIEKVTNENI